jgi:hypothetical protein
MREHADGREVCANEMTGTVSPRESPVRLTTCTCGPRQIFAIIGGVSDRPEPFQRPR